MALEYENIQTPQGQQMGLWRYGRKQPSSAVEVGEHFHLMSELMWFQSASGEIEVAGERWPLGPGTLLFVPPLLSHSLRVDGGEDDFYLLQYESNYYREIDLPLHLRPALQPVVVALDEAERERVNQLLCWAEEVSLQNPALRDSLLRSLLVYVKGLDGLQGEPGRAGQPLQETAIARLLPLVEHLEDEQNLAMSLDEAAEICGFSRYYFSRLFKRCFGQNFKEYLLKRRIASAAALLRSSELSLAQIAYRCEFTDSAYFCAKFRQTMGVTPGKFRREHGTKD